MNFVHNPLYLPVSNHYRTGINAVFQQENRFSESLTLSDDVTSDLYNTVKKIKVEDSSSYHDGYDGKNPELYSCSTQTVSPTSKTPTNMKLISDTEVSQPKVLLIKRHCYNLKGFSERSYKNIKIIADQSELSLFQSEFLVTRSDRLLGPITKNFFFEAKPFLEESFSGSGCSLDNKKIDGNRKDDTLKTCANFIKKNKLSGSTRIKSKILSKKPLSVLALTYIRQKQKLRKDIDKAQKSNGLSKIKTEEDSQATQANYLPSTSSDITSDGRINTHLKNEDS